MMININDILKTKTFENSVVIAGRKGLSNLVKTITVAETPDAANWLHGNELVCTSGFFMSNLSVTQAVNWVKSLSENKAAALAIKTSRFLGEVPEQVMSFANSNKFPLISLPDDITWQTIIETVINLINDHKALQLQHAKKIHEKLTQLVLDENNISKITQTFSDLLGHPIIVEDGKLNLITFAIPTSLEDIQKQNSKSYIQQRTNDYFRKGLLNSNYYKQVLTYRKKEILKNSLHNSIDTVTFPVLASDILYGFITLIEVEKKLLPTDIVSLEYGANAIALMLQKKSIEVNNRYKKEQETAQKLINGPLYQSTIDNIYPINWSSPIVVVLVQAAIENSVQGLFEFKHPKQIIEEIIRKSIRKTFGECIVGYEKNLFTIIVPLQNNQTKETKSKLKKTMELCLYTLSHQFPSLNINIAIGGVYSSRTKIKKSYEDAKITLEFMKNIPSIGPISSFELVGIYRLINNICNYEFLKSFVDYYLADLIEHDKKNNDILSETLQTFLQLEGNITATAKELFVHPNTISYRMRKIKSILGNNFDNHQYRISLLLALEINRYLNFMENNRNNSI